MASAGGIRAARAYVELSVRDMLDQGLSRGEKRLRLFARTVGSLGAKLAGAGAAGAIPLGAILNDYAKFSDRVAELRTVSQATTEQMQRLVAQANSLGTQLGIAPIETIQVQIELAKGGVKPDDIAKITRDVLALKTAAGQEVDTGLATQIGLDTLAQFKLPTDQFGRVADAYVAAANASTTSVVELSEGMRYAAPAAALAGESIERTAAALAVLASQGIKGEQGGTALRNAYLKMSDPKVRKELEKLTGVMATDSSGNLKPMASTLVEIGNAIKGMPNAERLGILDKIFGERALFAATGLGQGGKEFKDMLAEIEGASGITGRTAEGMADSLGGSFREASAQVHVLSNAIGKALDPALRGLLRDVTDVASRMTSLVETNPELVRNLVAGGGAASAFGVALMGVGLAARLGAGGLGLSRSGVQAMLSPLLVTLRTMEAISSLSGGGKKTAASPKSPSVTPPASTAKGPSRASNAMLAGRAIGGSGRVLAAPFVSAAGLIRAAWAPLKATGSTAPGVGMALGLQLAGATAGRVSGVFGFGAKIAGAYAMALTGTAKSTGLVAASGSQAATRMNPMSRVMQGIANSLFGVSVRADYSRSRLNALAAVKMPKLSFGDIAKGSANALGSGAKAVAFDGPRLAIKGLAQGLTGIVPLMGRMLGAAGVLFSPTGLLIGGIGLAAAAVVAASGGLSGFKTNLGSLLGVSSQVFGSLQSGASRTWSMLGPDAGAAINLVTQRIASGDWSGALSAGVAGLRLVWADVVAGFVAQWAPLSPALTDVWNATVGVLSATWDGFKAGFTGGLDLLKAGWQSVMSYFGADGTAASIGVTWADMLFGVQATLVTWQASLQSAWVSVGNSASNVASKIKDIWGAVIAQIAKWLLKIPGMADLLGGDANQIVSEITAQQKRDEAARTKQRETNNQATAEKQKQIEADKTQKIAVLDENREQKNLTDSKQVEQAKADAEYDRLMALQDMQDEANRESPEAREKRAKKTNEDWAKAQAKATELQRQKAALGQNKNVPGTLPPTMGDIAKGFEFKNVSGSFSGRAAAGMAIAPWAKIETLLKDQLKANQDTASNTKEMNKSLTDAGKASE